LESDKSWKIFVLPSPELEDAQIPDDNSVIADTDTTAGGDVHIYDDNSVIADTDTTAGGDVQILEDNSDNADNSVSASNYLALITNYAICPLCQEAMDTPRQLQSCQHIFCEPCLKKLVVSETFRNNPQCPLCRDQLP